MNIKIFGKINEATTELVLKKVETLKKRKNIKEIVIYIDSDGGCVDNTNKIRDALLPYKDVITTVALNVCSSNAISIFLLGSKRYTMPNCIFLFHRPFYMQDSFAKENEHITIPFLNERLKLLREDEKNLKEIYRESGFPNHFTKYLFSINKDIIVKIDDLLDWKILDGICDVELKYKISV